MEKLKYSDPHLYELLRHWPAGVFLPCVLLVIAALALVTHWWDQRDAGRAQERSRRADTGEGPPAAS